MENEYFIRKISNGYILTYELNGSIEEVCFTTKAEMFNFIDQIME